MLKSFGFISPVVLSIGFAAIRVITGVLMVYHGLEVFDAEKIKGYGQWLTDLNFPAPILMAYLGKGTEFVGGLLLAAGLFTRLAALVLAVTMLIICFGMGKAAFSQMISTLFCSFCLLPFFSSPAPVNGASTAVFSDTEIPFPKLKYMKETFLFSLFVLLLLSSSAQNSSTASKVREGARTYCNPLNIDYGYTPIPNFANWGRHRATADPVVVNYKGDYYLFSTNQWGYWWSSDMLSWNYVSRRFLRTWNTGTYDELCAPAVGIIGDTMIVFGSTYTNNFSIWMSTNPRGNDWKPLVDSFEIGGWDPSFFTDDDGKLYMYNGSSNKWPMYGIELNRKTFAPIGTRKEMYVLEPWRYGWQRFGEHMDNTFLDPFIEGSHLTKHNGKYYLQYGAPGTEFSGYADGLLVGDHPLGPWTPASDPVSLKLGGYVRGAGHGATFQDNNGDYWHISTTVLSVKNTFERRLGVWPKGFDKTDACGAILLLVTTRIIFRQPLTKAAK
jgi:uncharacterized membrane protein YphA (DoxX/SURF4 family)